MKWLGQQPNGDSQFIDQAVLSMGYKPDAILDTYADRICAGMPFECAVEPKPLGTAGGIAFGAAHAKIKESFVAVNGDILCDFSCAELIAAHRSNPALATIALTEVADPSRFGVVEISQSGQVERFVEKPGRGESTSKLINAGIYVLEPEVLEAIPENQSVSIERDIFPDLATKGLLFAHKCEGAWIDVGTPEAFLRAQFLKAKLPQGAHSKQEGLLSSSEDLLSEGLVSSSKGLLSSSEGLLQNSYVHPEAVLEGRALVANSVLMSQVQIKDDARVERSALLPGCVIEAGATVLDSIIGPKAVVGQNALVKDLSVISANVEAGSTLSGARHG